LEECPLVYSSAAPQGGSSNGGEPPSSSTFDYVWPDATLSAAEVFELREVVRRVIAVGGVACELSVDEAFVGNSHCEPVTIWPDYAIASTKVSSGPERWKAFLCVDAGMFVTQVAAAVAALRLRLGLLKAHGAELSTHARSVRVLPLSLIRYPGADGRLLGLALCWPTQRRLGECDDSEGSLERLVRGSTNGAESLDSIQLELPNRRPLLLRHAPNARLAHPCVRPEMWTRPSRVWKSVTPVIIEKAIKDPALGLEAIRRECEAKGLPVKDVTITHPWCAGGADAAEHSGPAAEMFDRQHITLELSHPVEGPLLLGEGAELGLGLLVPVDATSLVLDVG
jgi:CRISPR-associated protein Csb2